MKQIYYLSLFLVLYVYVVYPFVIIALASLLQIFRDFKHAVSRGERRTQSDELGELPSVTIVIAVYNEEKVIEERILNCLSLDYPIEKIEVIIASDGSNDRTNSIVQTYASERIRLLAFDERGGKAATLNRSIPKANGSILLLTDSNTMYQSNAVAKLVRHFYDPTIGGVCGKLTVKPADDTNVEESLYWKFENILKFMESRLNMTLGANGGIYAIRKEAFQPVPEGTIVDDFIIFLNVRKKGYRTIFDPEAVAIEQAAPSLEDEYKRKVRIGAGDFQAISLARSFLNPLRGPVSFSFWSHKVLRWCVPFFLIGLLVSNLFLAGEGSFYLVSLILQLLFYASFVLGRFVKGPALLRIPYYFVSMNLALLHGFTRQVRGAQKGTWERTRR